MTTSEVNELKRRIGELEKTVTNGHEKINEQLTNLCLTMAKATGQWEATAKQVSRIDDSAKATADKLSDTREQAASMSTKLLILGAGLTLIVTTFGPILAKFFGATP